MSHRTDWKGAAAVALSLAILGLAACGGSGGGAISHLSQRAFVSDDCDVPGICSGSLHIEDAAHDVESGFTIATGTQPGAMVLSPDKTITLVFNAGSFTLSVVSNSTESSLGTIALPNVSTSYVSMSDNTVGFVAVPNCPAASCGGNSNVVEVVDLATTFNITGTVPITQVATTLVLSPTENKLLVFGGPADHQDTLTVIDTATAKTTPATAATQIGPNPAFFSRPVSAVFSSDGNTAYVFNCGPECGAPAPATASVTVLDMTKTPPAPTTNIPVAGATTGLLNGNTLYVAGTPSGTPGAMAGRLSVLDTTALANGPTSSVPISDGTHNLMELASNNKLFIGAGPTCTAGCLTIFDTGTNQAGVDGTTPCSPARLTACPSNVTGIAPISARNVVYVVEDVAPGSYNCASQLPCLGKLRIYDTTASTPTLTPTQIDVVGKAVDVKYVDH